MEDCFCDVNACVADLHAMKTNKCGLECNASIRLIIRDPMCCHRQIRSQIRVGPGIRSKTDFPRRALWTDVSNIARRKKVQTYSKFALQFLKGPLPTTHDSLLHFIAMRDVSVDEGLAKHHAQLSEFRAFYNAD